MGSLNDIAWALIEETVQRGRGCDEEAALMGVARSYLVRRGLADTLRAFDEETRTRCELRGAHDNNTTTAAPDMIRARRDAQLLCLHNEYTAAAARLPARSLVRLKLLCLAALHGCRSSAEAMLSISEHVTPLIPLCDDPQAAHDLYMQFIFTIMMDGTSGAAADESRFTTARDVNEVLLPSQEPSALNVLLSWADWLDRASEQSAS